MLKDEFVLYGLGNHEEIIDQVIADLNAFENDFDIRLILTEALTNAFKHGNQNCIEKPIYLRYIYQNLNIKFEIEDSGAGLEDVKILKEIADENVLDISGKGLFLIHCLADKIELRKNTLIIQKKLNAALEIREMLQVGNGGYL